MNVSWLQFCPTAAFALALSCNNITGPSALGSGSEFGRRRKDILGLEILADNDTEQSFLADCTIGVSGFTVWADFEDIHNVW